METTDEWYENIESGAVIFRVPKSAAAQIRADARRKVIEEIRSAIPALISKGWVETARIYTRIANWLENREGKSDG